jgi:DNA-binding winged helix-turn-helix (wHTH) protein
MTTDPPKIRFGDVLFDLAARQVFRGAAEVHLSGKAFELLRYLIERRPQAVSKQDLQAHLWPDTFVTEANLPSLVAEALRRRDCAVARLRVPGACGRRPAAS